MNDDESGRLILRIERSGQPATQAELKRLEDPWAFIEGVAVEGRESTDYGITQARTHYGEEFAERCRASVSRAREEGHGSAAIPAAFDLEALGALAFMSTEYRMKWLAKHVLVADQPCVVAAPKKSLKTSVMIDLAVSLAAGLPFLEHGRFAIDAQESVLLLSGESGGFVIQDTVRRVCRSKEVDPGIMEGFFFVSFNLPQLGVQEQLDVVARFIREVGIKVVIIDPLYLCLISGGMPGRRLDPANLFDMGPLLMGVSRLCTDAGATPILVHHFRKVGSGDPYALPELENMAYAGIQEFARQWILLGRREKYEPGSGRHKLWMAVGGSAGHSGEWALDVVEGVMGEDFKGRSWEPSVRLSSEVREEDKSLGLNAKVEKAAEGRRAKDADRERVIDDDAERVLVVLRSKPSTEGSLRGATKLNAGRVKVAVELLAHRGAIKQIDIQIPNGRSAADGKERMRTVAAWAVDPTPSTIPMTTDPAGGHNPVLRDLT